MRKIVIVYGLISGLIVVAMFQIWMFFYQKGVFDFENGEIFGYGSMIVALSMIFFGIKSYRDNHNGGSIRFWKGVQVGLLISLIASFIYAAGWEIYVRTSPDTVNAFLEKYTEHYIDKLRKGGAAPEEINQTVSEMGSFREMYQNPLIRFGITIIEILPVGIIVTLISAALLRKKELLPAADTA